MLRDPNLMKAVSRVHQRAEKQTFEKLLETYVDVGILPQLENDNSQIIYGRRGTGKTHVTKVLAEAFERTEQRAVVFVDCRTLGSTSQFSDADLSIPVRCLALFRDLLTEVHNGLLSYVVGLEEGLADPGLTLLEEFGRVAVEPYLDRVPTKEVLEREAHSTGEAAAGLDLSTASPALRLSRATQGSESTKASQEIDVRSNDKIVFPSIKTTLLDLLRRIESKLVIVIDEWSSLPWELQPYLAEFVKRSFLPHQEVVVKIASLEYRSNFGERHGHDFLGFELGSDIATAVDIDDYFVYDRSPEAVTTAFADILFLHLRSELDEGYLEARHRISSGADLASRMFTERAVFEELVRAAEGVARDMINIFMTAFFDAGRRDRASIDKKAVVESARQWFEKDKAANLDGELQDVLRRIVDEVIGHRRARSFLIPRELEAHRIIRRLFDARVLHLMQRGYADKDNPGVRYNIYTLDYGTYVDLLNTKKQPQVELITADDPDNELVVPFDDKRSIRRIVLNADVLGAPLGEAAAAPGSEP